VLKRWLTDPRAESADETSPARLLYHRIPKSHNRNIAPSHEQTKILTNIYHSQAMIADLKADSERWDAERRQTASRGQPSNGTSLLRDSNGVVRKSNTPVVEYRASTTHQSRQYYGPTEAAPGATVGYPAPAGAGAQQGVYDNGSQYQQAYAQPVQGYGAPTQTYAQDNYYVAGADMAVDPRSAPRQPVQQAGTIPRTGAVTQYTSSTPTYQTQPDGRSTYYSSQTPVSSTQGYTSQQPADPFYGRGAYNHPPFSSLYSYFISEMNRL
jgi:hypothetical protein